MNEQDILKNIKEVCSEPFEFETKKLTNYEKIKNMSVEEMAKFLFDVEWDIYDFTELRPTFEWLRSEVEG